jgi:homoserine acetyltransferase
MGVVPMPADFGAVENRSFTISSFRLQIGAGKAVDTDRLFVVSANMLG